MNKVIMNGSIGEPKFREVNTKNGVQEVCSFGICQREGRGDNAVFSWYNAELWLSKDSKLRPYLVKGAKVLIDGELKTEKWKGQDGTERSSIKIAVRNLELLGDKQETAPATTPLPTTDNDDDGDLPDFLRG
jgi:single-strand DNA-binding protein